MAHKIKFITPKRFLKDAVGVLSEDDRKSLEDKLALNPDLGDLIQKTGGARKVWQFGTAGQARVIYYFHMGDGEIFFLTCYPKNAKSDLSQAEKKEMKSIITTIKNSKKQKPVEAVKR